MHLPCIYGAKRDGIRPEMQTRKRRIVNVFGPDGRHQENQKGEKDMSVNIHGKEYYTVAERINNLANSFEWKYSMTTEIIQFDEDMVVMKATLTCGGNQYTGHAFERAESSQINRTSHLENCETSAIGRALAAAGYAGTEYASANEVQNAIDQQADQNNIKKTPIPKTVVTAVAPTPISPPPLDRVVDLVGNPRPSGSPSYKQMAFILKQVNERELSSADDLFRKIIINNPNEDELLSLFTVRWKKVNRDNFADKVAVGFDSGDIAKLFEMYHPSEDAKDYEFLNGLPKRTYGAESVPAVDDSQLPF